MSIKDLLRAWEQAVDDATSKQPRAGEAAEMLRVRAGLRAGAWSWDPKGTGCFCTQVGCPATHFTCLTRCDCV